jgi:hypothetical protein
MMLQEAKDHVKKSKEQLQNSREKMIEQVTEECGDSRLSFVCVEYMDQLTGQEHVVSVACVGSFPSPPLGPDWQVIYTLGIAVRNCYIHL